jgi:hypothetical protein
LVAIIRGTKCSLFERSSVPRMPTQKTISAYRYSARAGKVNKTATRPEYTSSCGDNGSFLLNGKSSHLVCGIATTNDLAPSVASTAPSLSSIDSSSIHELPMQPNTPSRTDPEATNTDHYLDTQHDELQMHYDVMYEELRGMLTGNVGAEDNKDTHKSTRFHDKVKPKPTFQHQYNDTAGKCVIDTDIVRTRQSNTHNTKWRGTNKSAEIKRRNFDAEFLSQPKKKKKKEKSSSVENANAPKVATEVNPLNSSYGVQLSEDLCRSRAKENPPSASAITLPSRCSNILDQLKICQSSKEISSKDSPVDRRTFEEYVLALLLFKQQFNHCNVPRRYISDLYLGRWCNMLRLGYKALRQGCGDPRGLNEDRIRLLEKIGFQWFGENDMCDPESFIFYKRLDQLISIQDSYKSYNVPAYHELDPSLGLWCNRMRLALEALQCGSDETYGLNSERYELLNDIGFWDTISEFYVRFDELKAFAEKYGHCKVTEEYGHCKVPSQYNDNIFLSDWTSIMRSHYQRLQKGRGSAKVITDEKVKLLTDIGFQWSESCDPDGESLDKRKVKEVYIRGKNLDKSSPQGGQGHRSHEMWPTTVLDSARTFGEWFAELIAFQEKFGHCNVTTKCLGDYRLLGLWCKKMRSEYEESLSGKLNENMDLNPRRTKLLLDLGFEFDFLPTLG